MPTLQEELAQLTAAARRLAARGDRTQRILQELIDQQTAAALVADDAGRFVLVNAAACALTQYTAAELLRLSVWQITPNPQEREAETLWRAFLQQRDQTGAYRICTKEGRVVLATYAAGAHVLPGFHVSLLRP
jgi:PAS domain S-box-containing protein